MHLLKQKRPGVNNQRSSALPGVISSTFFYAYIFCYKLQVFWFNGSGYGEMLSKLQIQIRSLPKSWLIVMHTNSKSPYLVQIRENTDQKYSVYEQVWLSEAFTFIMCQFRTSEAITTFTRNTLTFSELQLLNKRSEK